MAGNDLTLVALPSTEPRRHDHPLPGSQGLRAHVRDQLKPELVSRTVTNIEDLTSEGVKALFDVWGRADVTNLQKRVLRPELERRQEAVTAPFV